MTLKSPIPDFAKALRAARLGRDLSQEDFYDVSGRTYVSRLENGGADPTLSKIVQLAQVLEIHPLTLVTLAFCSKGTPAEIDRLLASVTAEIESFEDLQLDQLKRHRRGK